MSFGPPIETLDDYNARLAACGCCEIPVCPTPTKECESISVTICGYTPFGFNDPESDDYCRVFSKRVDSYEIRDDSFFPEADGSGATLRDLTYTETLDWSYIREKDVDCDETISETFTQDFDAHWTLTSGGANWTHAIVSRSSTYVAGVCSGTENTWYQSGAGTPTTATNTYNVCPATPHTVTVSWTRSEAAGVITYHLFDDTTFTAPNTGYRNLRKYVKWEDEIILSDVLATKTFPSDVNGSLCYSSNQCTVGIKSRYRWVIPDTFLGSYFKITWDILLDPSATGEASSLIDEDITWEWTGPGDPEDADSWKSTWFELDLPTTKGQVRIVNVRFICYHGTKFGTRPQVTGEAFEP